MGLSGKQRRIVFRGIFKDKRMKNRVSVAFGLIPFLWGFICFSLFVFELTELAFAAGGLWLLILLWSLISPQFNSPFVISALYKDVLRKWKAFLIQLAGGEDQARETEPAKLNPEISISAIISRHRVIHRRMGEIHTRKSEIHPLVREVKEIAIDLTSEWERMDKVYLLYLRGNDIASAQITGKALSLIRGVTEKTDFFAKQLEKLGDSLNRIEAFELETEIAKELGTQLLVSPEADFVLIRGMIADLRDWSRCLTEAQEELDREGL